MSGANKVLVKVRVNGELREAEVEPRTLLVDFLREHLNLTGTHVGCDTTYCGACTVILNGRTVKSCTIFAPMAGGGEITTVEGLAANGVLHMVQKAWIDHDVPQCGYCQSGMIMAVAALLKEKPKPTDAEIDEAITNICRCGTFQQVREAIHIAASA